METKKTNLLIIGAGLSGLLAAAKAEKCGMDYLVIEKSQALPKAKIHYLHSDMNNALPIKLKKIEIFKNIYWKGEFLDRFNIPMMNEFACKTNEKLTENSIKYINGEREFGYIPFSGIENISDELFSCLNRERFIFGAEYENSFNNNESNDEIIVKLDTNEKIICKNIISTIPLPVMLKTLGVDVDCLKTMPLNMIELKINKENREKILETDLYEIIYLPSCEFGMSRFSILGKRFVIELAEEEFDEKRFEEFFGIFSGFKEKLNFKYIKATNPYGRFCPIDEDKRIELINRLIKKKIYPAGRYASWKYKRVDSVADDIEEIFKKIN